MRLYISDIRENVNLEGVELLTESRRENLKKFVKKEDQIRCLESGLLLRKHLQVTADGQLAFGDNGKPYLRDGSVHFNLSHSGDYVVLVVGEREIGVDIERVSQYKEAVAKRCFTAEELALLRKEGNLIFYQLWAAKEAYMKATGAGFTLNPQNFSVLPLKDGKHEIDGEVWEFAWKMVDDYVLCVVEKGYSEY